MPRQLPPLNALRSFAAAVEAGSFTKAGEALCVTQGAISRQVKQLENWIGKPLFLRTAQGLALTEAGRILAAGIDGAFKAIQGAVAAAQGSAQRLVLKVNLPPTFAARWLAPRLAGFREAHPHIDFSLTTDFAQQPRDLRSFDAAVVFADGDWGLPDSSRLFLEQHLLVASPSLWRKDGIAPPIEDGTLLHVLEGSARLPLWQRWCETNGARQVDPHAGLEFSTLNQVINAAVGGAGIAIVDRALVQPELRAGLLREIDTLSPDGPHGYWFMNLARDAHKRDSVGLLHDWMRQQVRAQAG